MNVWHCDEMKKKKGKKMLQKKTEKKTYSEQKRVAKTDTDVHVPFNYPSTTTTLIQIKKTAFNF